MVGRGVSLIVPTLNRRGALERLLGSIDGLWGLRPHEVIIVDGGSSDGSVELLEGWASRDHHYNPVFVRQRHRGGPGHARNLGVKESSEDIVAFTDDDCVVHPLWLANLVVGLDGDESVVGVGGRVRAVRDDLFSKYYVFHQILEPPSSLLYLVSANCCYRRGAVLAAGGFDEGIVHPGGEDVGLSIRLLQIGGRFIISEDAVVYHEFRSGLADFIRTFFNYGAGCSLVSSRYKSPGTWPSASPYGSQFNGLGSSLVYGALNPPPLNPRDIWRDSLSAIREYRAVGIGILTACGFLFLRTLQRFAYASGWRSDPAIAKPNP